MKAFLGGLFIVILLAMAAATFTASMKPSLFQGLAAGSGRIPGSWPYFWLHIFRVSNLLRLGAYKERSAFSRILWFFLIMGLGNMEAKK